jgi:hypothetical protein
VKWQDDMLAGQVQGSHYSYQPLGEWNSRKESDADIFLAEKGALADEWQNRMGYWFRMTEASYPGDLANGSVGRLSFTVRNDGVAPIYLKGNTGVVEASLMDAQGRVLEVVRLKDVNPFDWKSGKVVTSVAEISFARRERAEKLALGVFSKEGLSHPDIKLGIEGGSDQNWYVLSDMPRERIDPAKTTIRESKDPK